MSQPNENYPPSFNFVVDEHYLDTGHYPSQWSSSGPQTMQHSMPSPSTSVRSNMIPLDPRLSAHMCFNHPNLSPQDSSIDPTLSLLAPPQAIYDKFAHQFRDEPWTPHRMMNVGHDLPCLPSASYGAFRSGPGSDMDSVPPFSDSGYGASGYGSIGVKPAHSVTSNEPECTNQELPLDVTFQIASMDVESSPSETLEIMSVQYDQVPNNKNRSNVQERKFSCDDPECHEVFKCKSDHKKHMLKHQKPFTCDVRDCKRNTQGFTTVNDLDRHKKSVHGTGLHTDGKSYKCASKNCRNKEKLWPRLDNFKQHIERMHRDEDKADLIKKSQYCLTESAPATDILPMVPMDTTLAIAGIGADNTYTGRHLDKLSSPMSPSSDQNASRWSSFDMVTDNLTMDIEQPSKQLNKLYSKTIDPPLHNPQGHMATQNQRSGPQTRRSLSKMSATTAKDVAPKPAYVNKQGPKLRHRTPQTKVEQQRLAFQNITKVITEEFQRLSSTSSDPGELEELVRLMLNETSGVLKQEWDTSVQQAQGHVIAPPLDNEDDAAILSKKEALPTFQTGSNSFKQSLKSTSMPLRRSSQGNSSKTEKCEQCGYEARPCDLRKHMKRHEKPYGCTYPRCYKRFGAKSDWKRHENSQHFQLEAFRCGQQSFPPGTACGEHFRGPEQFKKHLETQHKLSPPEQSQEVKRCKIGKNYQVQFWCGFCEEIKPLTNKRNAAWDERFDHIAHHFEKDKKSIEEWVCVEENKMKQELKEENEDKKKKKEKKERKDQTGTNEEVEDVDAVGEIDDSPPPSVDMEVMYPATPALLLQPVSQQFNSKKRQAPVDTTQSQLSIKKTRVDRIYRNRYRVRNRYCCFCRNGPWSLMDASCLYCDHHLCDDCVSVDEFSMEVNDLTCRG